ncbi:MAG: hypothetical protein HDQ88_11800 [Clostridia bacterium]|nr:hypothetical protein [Clostridia bacterium]
MEWNELENYDYVNSILMPEFRIRKLFHNLSLDFDRKVVVELLSEVFHVTTHDVRCRLLDLGLV